MACLGRGESARPTAVGVRGGYFLLPPSASGASLRGEAIEEVRLVRDEMANRTWGIEKVTKSGVGTRWPGHERADRLGSEPNEYMPAAPDAPPVKYMLQTRVPEHWIPLIPRQVDAACRSIALQRGAVLRPPQNNQPAQPILPMGRILNPSNPAHAPNLSDCGGGSPARRRPVRKLGRVVVSGD